MGSPACCGCIPLFYGLQLICLIYLLGCIIIIASCSSVVPLQVAGVEIGTVTQLLAGSWAFVGIPLTVGAGVAAWYRIESHIRLFFNYSVATLFFGFCWWVWFLQTGDICQTMVTQDVQRLGTAFVCGFTDTMVVFYLLMGSVVNGYFSYIIYAFAEEIKFSSYPDIIKYSSALQGDVVPIMAPVQAVEWDGGMMQGPGMQSMGVPPGYGGVPQFGGAAMPGMQPGYGAAPMGGYGSTAMGGFAPAPQRGY